ncbi:hypothetical protein OKJ48_25615 [Streptomyces kunmingensis]|uniref:Uncharacterized protein n=1 Tax=Streptomyces kunmingensis TaxID=68225 RepID=A0ABU6CFV6_9ACTN|nr:hypothetical protein [Streptomyces kunmingensis]MEB3963592.1 hypothetical protein [Streptomyces kunmingensis]
MHRARNFLHPTGRHRLGASLPPPPVIPPLMPHLAATVRPWHTLIDGATTPLVRPYLVAHEHEETARLQRLRRDTLWCATYGIDLDDRNIHDALRAA